MMSLSCVTIPHLHILLWILVAVTHGLEAYALQERFHMHVKIASTKISFLKIFRLTIFFQLQTEYLHMPACKDTCMHTFSPNCNYAKHNNSCCG